MFRQEARSLTVQIRERMLAPFHKELRQPTRRISHWTECSSPFLCFFRHSPISFNLVVPFSNLAKFK